MADAAEPIEIATIDVERERALVLKWSDGVAAEFAIQELRISCPCAECRSRRERGEPAWRPNLLAPPLAIRDAELVGAWGISFTWSDGHSTGIYAWDALRRWATEDEEPPTG